MFSLNFSEFAPWWILSTAHPGSCNVIWLPLHIWLHAVMKEIIKAISWILHDVHGWNDWWDAGCLLQPPAGPEAKLPLTPADSLEPQCSALSSVCVCVFQGGGGLSCVVAILVIAVLLWQRHQGSLTAEVWQASRVRSESCWKLICTGNIGLSECDRERQR